jgi:hypothetical protein
LLLLDLLLLLHLLGLLLLLCLLLWLCQHGSHHLGTLLQQSKLICGC